MRSSFTPLVALSLALLGPTLARAQAQRPTLGVLPVRVEARGVKGLTAPSAEGLRDAVEAVLLRTHKLTIVDRKQLGKALDESGLGELGLTDPKATVRAGKLLGADYLLEVRVAEWSLAQSQRQIPISNRWQRTSILAGSLTIRVVSAETGKVAVSQSVGASDEWIEESANRFSAPSVARERLQALEARVLGRLRDAILVAFPMKVVTVDPTGVVFLNYGKGTGVRVGDVVSITGIGTELRDPDSGELLGKSETEIARVEVVSVEAKFCTAKLVSGSAPPRGARCKIIREDPRDWPRARPGGAVR